MPAPINGLATLADTRSERQGVSRSGCNFDPVCFDLPFPPSVNNLFSQTKAGRRYPSKRYRTWRSAAEWSLTAARPKPIRGKASIVIELAPHDRRARDADNFIKAILDLLVANMVIEGDSQRHVHEVTSRWLEPTRPAVAHVTIYPAEK